MGRILELPSVPELPILIVARAEDGSFTLDQEPTLNRREIDDINVCLESIDHPEPLLFLLLVIQVLCNYYCKCII